MTRKKNSQSLLLFVLLFCLAGGGRAATAVVQQQRRAPCQYGAGCYRMGNSDHRRECAHPGDADWAARPAGTTQTPADAAAARAVPPPGREKRILVLRAAHAQRAMRGCTARAAAAGEFKSGLRAALGAKLRLTNKRCSIGQKAMQEARGRRGAGHGASDSTSGRYER